MKRKAIGIIRVSEVNGRAGSKFHSPAIQRDRIERDCELHDLALVEVLDELDVSGGKPIAERPATFRALHMVEAGEVGAIVYGYRDRVDRSIVHGAELCQRMDAAGALLIAEGATITHSTHDGWRKATMESFLNEDQRRAVASKLRDVQVRAIAQGKAPFSVPPGYRKRPDGTTEVNLATRDAVRHAFALRAARVGCPTDANSLPAIRKYLAKHSIKMSLGGLVRMLANRFYLGELHYGDLENLTAHDAIISRELFDRVQEGKGGSRGRIGKSDRLLARLGVLRCSCGGRMSVSSKANRVPIEYFYRCTNPDCTIGHRVTISAPIAEKVVGDAVREAIADERGRATAAQKAHRAAGALREAQEALDGATRAFVKAGLSHEPVAVEELATLREARDIARVEADRAGVAVSVEIDGTADWDDLPLDVQRKLIVATVESATVSPLGRGAERLLVTLK